MKRGLQDHVICFVFLISFFFIYLYISTFTDLQYIAYTLWWGPSHTYMSSWMLCRGTLSYNYNAANIAALKSHFFMFF